MDRKIIKSVEKFAEIVNKEFNVKKIILYGSYAKGTSTDYSDIDVAVIFDRYDGDVLKANSRLFSIVRDIDVRIEPVLLEMQNDRSGFIDSISKYGKVVYTS
jgi:uncharacterized protein